MILNWFPNTLGQMSEAAGNQLDAAGEVALERALRRAWAPVCRADELTDAPSVCFAGRMPLVP